MGLGATSCLFLLFTGLEICNPDLRVWIADLQTKQFQQKQRASISLPNKHTQCDPRPFAQTALFNKHDDSVCLPAPPAVGSAAPGPGCSSPSPPRRRQLKAGCCRCHLAKTQTGLGSGLHCSYQSVITYSAVR